MDPMDKQVSEMSSDEIIALANSFTRTDVAVMIADWFGRSAIDSDYELADQIIARVRLSS
jgi:hypothetical protein